MLDALALTALIGQCAPGQAAAPLVAIVREASGFEPLVLSTMQNGRPLSLQAFSKAIISLTHTDRGSRF